MFANKESNSLFEIFPVVTKIKRAGCVFKRKLFSKSVSLVINILFSLLQIFQILSSEDAFDCSSSIVWALS